MTGVAVVATFFVRFERPLLHERLAHLPLFLPPFIAFAGVVYWFSQLYKSKWRFASLPDLFNIFRAATILAVTLLVVDYVLVSPQLRGTFFFGKITIALYWLIQMFLLGGPRLAFRYLKYAPLAPHPAARFQHADPAARARRHRGDPARHRGRHGQEDAAQGHPVLPFRRSRQSIRGVPVLGTFADLDQVIQDFHERGTPIRRLLATPSALTPEANPDMLIAPRRLGLPLVRVTSLGEGMRDAELAPLEIEDLLLRPTVQIDRSGSRTSSAASACS